MLCDLGINPEEKKKKLSKKKKMITIDAEVTNKKGGSSRTAAGVVDKGTLHFRQSNLEDYVIISDSLEGLSRIGEKKIGAAGSKSSGSVGSRNPDAGATPSSNALDDEEEEEEEPAEKLISRKRSREETTVGASVAQKTGEAPPFKSARLEAEKEKKKAAEKPVDKTAEKERDKKKASEKPVGDDPKETGAAATTAHEKTQGPEVVHITGLDQPLHEKKKKETVHGKGPEVVKPTEPAQVDAPTQTAQVASAARGSAATSYKDATTAAVGAGAASDAGRTMPQTTSPKDTMGDIYYMTYTEEVRGNAPHQAPWVLKQKDTFL
ncbi:hypothetical protein Hdeb2414_s0012g00382621 [Helianthus debilis subsp. tardiflorus]